MEKEVCETRTVERIEMKSGGEKQAPEALPHFRAPAGGRRICLFINSYEILSGHF